MGTCRQFKTERCTTFAKYIQYPQSHCYACVVYVAARVYHTFISDCWWGENGQRCFSISPEVYGTRKQFCPLTFLMLMMFDMLYFKKGERNSIKLSIAKRDILIYLIQTQKHTWRIPASWTQLSKNCSSQVHKVSFCVFRKLRRTARDTVFRWSEATVQKKYPRLAGVWRSELGKDKFSFQTSCFLFLSTPWSRSFTACWKNMYVYIYILYVYMQYIYICNVYIIVYIYIYVLLIIVIICDVENNSPQRPCCPPSWFPRTSAAAAQNPHRWQGPHPHHLWSSNRSAWSNHSPNCSPRHCRAPTSRSRWPRSHRSSPRPGSRSCSNRGSTARRCRMRSRPGSGRAWGCTSWRGPHSPWIPNPWGPWSCSYSESRPIQRDSLRTTPPNPRGSRSPELLRRVASNLKQRFWKSTTRFVVWD